MPAVVRPTCILGTAELLALVSVLDRSLPCATTRLARALVAACVSFQARWSELTRARVADLALEPQGAVLRRVFSKTSKQTTAEPSLVYAPHVGAELTSLCCSAA